MNDIMLDLETLGVDSNAPIIQIGLVEFDRETGELGEEKELTIDIDDCLIGNFKPTGSTIRWWCNIPKEIIDAVLNVENKYKLLHALFEISPLLNGHILWCHASFDAPILVNAFNNFNLEFPIPFYKIRDLRTIVDITMINCNNYKLDEDKAHTALSDCKYQIRYLVAGLQKLKGNSNA